MFKKNYILFSFALLLVYGCNGGIEKSEAPKIESLVSDEIVVGDVETMSGADAIYGIASHQGIMMAVDAVNSAGGLLGKKVRVVVADDAGKPEEAAKAVDRLIRQEKVSAILGGVASSRSLKMAPVAQSKQTPMITPSSTHPSVTEVGDYIFRVCFIDPFQGPVMAKFAHDILKSKRVAIMRDLKSEYSMGLAQFFKGKYVELGGKVVAEEDYSTRDLDFLLQLKKIRLAHPDLVYIPGYYSDVALIVRQAKQLKMKMNFAGGDGWDSQELSNPAGSPLEGSYFTTHYSFEGKDPRLVEFLAAYRKQYRTTPDALAALGYDAASVLFDAFKRAHSTSHAEVRNALASTKDFPGVTGTITLDEKRNAIKPAVILKVEKGKAAYIETFAP